MANRQEEDDCRDDVERLRDRTAGKPLPNIRDVFVVVAIGRTWKGGQIRRRLSASGVTQAGGKSANENNGQADPYSRESHVAGVWRFAPASARSLARHCIRPCAKRLPSPRFGRVNEGEAALSFSAKWRDASSR